MKRVLGFLIMLVLSTVVFSVVAQEERNTLREVAVRDTYGDNWFISLNGNANLLTAEQDGYVSAWKRMKFGGAFTVGKWFNPDFGARFQVTGGSLRGFNDQIARVDGYYVHDNFTHLHYPLAGDPLDERYASKYKFYTVPSGRHAGIKGFWQDFNYASATFDLMANFTNLMRGHYRERNPIDVIPFVGAGAIYSFNNKVTTPRFYHWVAKIGFRVNFNVTNNIAVYLEPQASATSEELDGYAGTAVGDGIVNLGLGLQYTFNKRFTSMYDIVNLTADEIDRLNKKINDNRYLIENHQDILERQQNLLDRLGKSVDELKARPVSPTTVVEGNWLPEYIRFALDSYKIESSEMRKIIDAADHLKKTPSSKLLIVGYADRKTGNPPYNFKLSQRRVEAVAAEFKRLGIESNRILIDWKGDKEQPFPQNEWNRVVVMVERK